MVAERIGWQRGMTVLRDRLRDLRRDYVPADPASRTAYQPGELVQCDLWFPPPDIPLGFGQVGSPPVLVMVSGYSRWITARMLPTRSAADLIAGHWRLLTGLGAVPKALVWDNEGAVGSWRGGRPRLTEDFAAFAGLLGIRIVQCRPGDPEAKGLVERANGYLETSFLPGRVFASPTDFNVQLEDWLRRANRRVHRTLQARPADRIDADRAGMLPLPPVDPPGWWRTSLRLPRDHYVRVDTCDYSVHPLAIGRQIEVKAGLEEVLVFCEGTEVARHVRCWARHQTITDPAHSAAAGAARLTACKEPADDGEVEVEQRSLDTYDRIFGVIEGGLGQEEEIA